MQNTCGMNNQHLCFFEWNEMWTCLYERMHTHGCYCGRSIVRAHFVMWALLYIRWLLAGRQSTGATENIIHPSIHPWFIPSPTKQQFRTSERSIIKGTYIVCVLHDHRPHICRSNTFRVKRPDDRSCGEMDIRTFLLKLSECEATRHALPQCCNWCAQRLFDVRLQGMLYHSVIPYVCF